MALRLHTIKPNQGARKKAFVIGRGLASKGTYSGRGAKGQRARSGGRAGLQLKGIRKLMLSMPKSRGFHSAAPKAAIVSLGAISKAFQNGAAVTPKALYEKGLVADLSHGVKILSDGGIALKVHVEGCRLSAAARARVEEAGGSVK